MTNVIKAKRLHNGDEAVLFVIEVDGIERRCMVSREMLNDLSRSTSSGDDLLREFDEHSPLIAKKAALVIRGGLQDNPLLIPAEVFFPKGECRMAKITSAS